MVWIYSAYPHRRACNGSKAGSASVSRTRTQFMAGMGLARHRHTAGLGDFCDGADQGLGANAAQEKSAAAERRSDGAEGIRTGRRRQSGQETRAAEENVRLLFRAAGNGSGDSRRRTVGQSARRTATATAGDGAGAKSGDGCHTDGAPSINGCQRTLCTVGRIVRRRESGRRSESQTRFAWHRREGAERFRERQDVESRDGGAVRKRQRHRSRAENSVGRRSESDSDEAGGAVGFGAAYI